MFKLHLEKSEEAEIKLPLPTGSSKNQENSRKTSTSASLTRLNLWHCGSQWTVEKSLRDGNTRLPYLPPEKPVCRSRSERVIGRKARDLQTEEIGCKCRTFFYLSLKWQEDTNYKCQIFFPSLYKIKRFLLKFCVAMTTPGSTWT